MALGTITINKVVKTANSPFTIVDMSVQGDDAYPTNGTLAVEATLRAAVETGDGLAGSLSNLDLLGASMIGVLLDSLPQYDAAGDRLLVQVISTGAEKGNASDQSGEVYRMLTFWS